MLPFFLFPGQPKITLDSVVESFECQRSDEHLIEGRDNGVGFCTMTQLFKH